MQGEDGRSINGVRLRFSGAFRLVGDRAGRRPRIEWSDGPSAVVTESLGAGCIGAKNPLRRSIHRTTHGLPSSEIVGVVGNIAYNGPASDRETSSLFHVGRTKRGVEFRRHISFVRAEVSPTRAGCPRGDRSLAVHYIYVMDEQGAFVAWSMERERMLATLSGALAA